MKSSFSLIEVLVATLFLSIAMLSLNQVQSSNIFILNKAQDTKKDLEYLNLIISSEVYSKRNKNLYLSQEYKIDDDTLRRELKDIKFKVKDEIDNTYSSTIQNINFKISNVKTTYILENKISKNIYGFKIEF